MPSRAGLIRAVNRALLKRPWRTYALEALEVLEDQDPALAFHFSDGHYVDVSFVDLFCQTSRPDQLAFEEWILVALAWQDILAGHTIYKGIQVREPAGADTNVEHNDAILQDMRYVYQGVLPIVRAHFWGGTQGADGVIEFQTAPISHFQGCAYTPGQELGGAPSRPLAGTCTVFPLEVGYCLPHQMIFHFSQSHCVARFPYGYDMLVLLETLDVTQFDKLLRP
jgi:hypothetical protein